MNEIKSEVLMIKTVRHMLNDKLLVFDERGKPMPTFQGRFDDKIEMIMQAAVPETEFYVQGLIFRVSQELFRNKEYFNFIKGRNL